LAAEELEKRNERKEKLDNERAKAREERLNRLRAATGIFILSLIFKQRITEVKKNT